MVGAMLFIIVNLFLVSSFLSQKTKLKAAIASRTSRLKSLQVLFADRQLWEKRQRWLDQNQPRLSNENGAGVQLLEYIKDVAKKNDVLLENPGFAAPEKTTSYHAISVNVETKSSWASLVAFLRSVQAPERFLVFESANIQIDPTDPAQMHGKFKIARWYAP